MRSFTLCLANLPFWIACRQNDCCERSVLYRRESTVIRIMGISSAILLQLQHHIRYRYDPNRFEFDRKVLSFARCIGTLWDGWLAEKTNVSVASGWRKLISVPIKRTLNVSQEVHKICIRHVTISIVIIIDTFLYEASPLIVWMWYCKKCLIYCQWVSYTLKIFHSKSNI